jgi:hypothetical protein
LFIDEIWAVDLADATGPPVLGNIPPVTFPEVNVAQTEDISVPITNHGAAPLQTSSTSVIGVDAAEFAVAPTYLIVQPGATVPLTVSFTPLSGGQKAATLTLSHNTTLRGNSKEIAVIGSARETAIQNEGTYSYGTARFR